MAISEKETFLRIHTVMNKIRNRQNSDGSDVIGLTSIYLAENDRFLPAEETEFIIGYLERKETIKIIDSEFISKEDGWDEPIKKYHYFWKILINNENFEEYIDHIEYLIQVNSVTDLQKNNYYYSPSTGKGNIKGEDFMLQKDCATFKVFGNIVAEKELSREKMLQLLGLKDDDCKGVHTANTVKIKDTIAQIRNTTKLNKYDLSLNNGSATLNLLIEIPTDPH